MLLFNPKNGATIRDMWIFDKLYFSVKAEEEFKPGDIIDVEDKVGKFLLEICGFLEEVSAVRAKNIIADRSVEKFICDVCQFESKNKIGLVSHKRTHESVVEGVRVIKPIDPNEEVEEEKVDTGKAIIEEALASGLEKPVLEIS